MSKPYDAATKRLIELRPADWVQFIGLPPGPVSLVDADLSTVSAAADRLIRVDAPIPYVMHNELESGKDTATVPVRVYHYNASAFYKLRTPVISNVFLLHKESNSPQITGELTLNGPDGLPYLSFRYNVVRVWELDVDQILSGGLGTLPLAPISKVRKANLPQVIQKMESRIDAEATNDTEAGELWTATYVLLGLRYPEAFNAQILQGVRRMKESVTYQAILREGALQGKIEEAQRMMLRAGLRRLGPPTPEAEAKVMAVASVTQLEMLLDRVFDVETWDELLRDL